MERAVAHDEVGVFLAEAVSRGLGFGVEQGAEAHLGQHDEVGQRLRQAVVHALLIWREDGSGVGLLVAGFPCSLFASCCGEECGEHEQGNGYVQGGLHVFLFLRGRAVTSSVVFDSPPSRRVGSWRLRREERPSEFSARVVTRVESTAQGPKSKIDWLNATFDAPPLSVGEVLDYLCRFLSVKVDATRDGGLFGFTERYRIRGWLDDGARVEIGAIAKGGEQQRGRWMVQLTGKGCGLVADWPGLQGFLSGLGALISRVDLAVDFLQGEYSVDDAMELYSGGAFTSRGRNPDLDIQGAWDETGVKGRTVYIGKLKNGKTLCVYEKGRQLKDYESDWTRYEVRLGNRDRVIPLDVLTNPDKYFTGAYPALAGMLSAAAEEVPTVRSEVKTSLANLTYHLERCYGKAIHQVLSTTGVSAAELVEEVRVVGIPRRVDPAGGGAGVDWADLTALKRRMEA